MNNDNISSNHKETIHKLMDIVSDAKNVADQQEILKKDNFKDNAVNLKGFYDSLVNAGFDKFQAFDLTCINLRYDLELRNTKEELKGGDK